MNNEAEKNAGRFLGFADIYEQARPVMPIYPVNIIKKYLGGKPDKVVDLGCGTGLSTLIWENHCNQVIGIDPNEEMLSVARKKETGSVSFRQAFSHETGIADDFADVVMCAQSFHWMEPTQTLVEINRILKPNGIFAAIDYDLPPVCNWKAEKAYDELFHQVELIEQANTAFKDSFIQWDKNNHLTNIKNSGYFRFAREIVFSNTEKCTSERLINLALSQGIIKAGPELISGYIAAYKNVINDIFGDQEFDVDFCYRMRLGVK